MQAHAARGAAISVAILAVVVAASPRPAAASPLELFGFGARSPALAGTGVASSDGYESVYLNPAGLAKVPGKRATVGLVGGDFRLEMDGEDTGTEPAKGLVIGGEFPLPLGGSMKDRVGFGFGFWVPAVALNRARAPFPGTPTFTLLENRSHVIALQIAAGVKINEKLDVGAGVIALAVLRGGIHVSTDSAGRFATTSEQQLLTRFAPVAGVRWKHSDRLDLGAVLRWVSRSDYDIAVTTDIGDVVPIQLPPIRIAGNAQYDPLTVAVEAAWRIRPDLLWSGQLQWQHWSAFPLPTLNPVSGTPPQEAPGFHDTVVPRASLEWTRELGAVRVVGRAGAAFHLSPAKEASGRQSFLDNHRMVGSVGLGLALPRSSVPLYLDAWFQHHYLIPRRHEKNPDAFDPGDEIPFDVLDTKGEVLVGGLCVGLAI
jgi:long-chain fatty acid transport protein